jgi:hypothetical protein
LLLSETGQLRISVQGESFEIWKLDYVV